MRFLVIYKSNIFSRHCEKYTHKCIWSRPTILFGKDYCNTASNKENVKILENMDPTNVEEQEYKIEKLRDKSRLAPDLRNILFNKKPYSEPMAKFHLTVKYNRRMYGLHGSESGVNPGIMWPTKDDIQTRKEYEKVAYPFTIQEMVSAAEKEKEMKELRNQNQQEKVVMNLAKLEAWKQNLKEKIAKKESEALAAQEKKERLIEEVRRHFGFKVNLKDERFKEMLAKKQKEQSKAERQARLEEREKKAIAKLLEKHQSDETA